jgi:hypothetical protein
MLKLLLGLPGFISGAFSTINNITAAISNEKINARNAQTEEERIAADERVKSLEARRDLMIVEAGVTKANIIVRSAAAVPIVIVLWKLLVWDWREYSRSQWKIVMLVLGFYFLYEGAIASYSSDHNAGGLREYSAAAAVYHKAPVAKQVVKPVEQPAPQPTFKKRWFDRFKKHPKFFH